MKIDKFSYHLGAADCFCEMVCAGVKRIALSHPCDTKDEAFLTDLFPLSLNQGKVNVIFYQDETVLQEYLGLKAEKEKAIAAGNYDDCREDIARRYGKLLSYTDEGIKRLLDANSETEE